MPKILFMYQVKQFCFNPFGENTYVIYDETLDCAVIDPGNSSQQENLTLFNFIDGAGLHPVVVLITHGHVDHIAGAALTAERYGIGIAAHPDARPFFTSVFEQAAMFGFGKIDKVPSLDQELEEYGSIKIGTGMLEAIPTPGHANGSMSFYSESDSIVFTGDTLFCRSIGRTDFVGGDFDTLRRSIRERLFVLPDDTMVLSGHGESTTIGDEKDFNPFVAL